jgi:hypothetical protein
MNLALPVRCSIRDEVFVVEPAHDWHDEDEEEGDDNSKDNVTSVVELSCH